MSAHAEEFQTLCQGVHYWSFYNPAVKCEVGSTAIQVPNGLVVIDPTPLAEPAWKELLEIAPLRAILLTNGNHVRVAAELRKQHSVPIAIAPDTRRDITELKADVLLMPNELLYGIAAIPIPGATPGETAFFAPSGVMVIGDAVINTSLEVGLEFLPDKYCTDAAQNRESLKKLLDYDFHTLIFAHGAPLTNHAKEKLSALLKTHS
jgi:glyoxylase-like metal-dependent hydrolase (beta-lactamase superfamily II)